MAFQVRSYTRKEWRKPAIVRGLSLACAFSLLVVGQTREFPRPQGKRFRGLRLEVTDSVTHRPLEGAAVSLTSWRRTESGEQKLEIEVRTDKNGISELPSVEGEKLAVEIILKGYRTFSRWVRPEQTKQSIRVKLEKWPNNPQRQFVKKIGARCTPICLNA
jgi:hypothetical protein